MDWFSDTARAFGANPATVKFPLFIPEAARIRANELLRQSGIDPEKPYAVMNAATGNNVRRWGAERFAESVVKFSQRFGLPSVLIGSEKDAALNQEIVRLASNQAQSRHAAVDLAGKTGLKELAALLERCAFTFAATPARRISRRRSAFLSSVFMARPTRNTRGRMVNWKMYWRIGRYAARIAAASGVVFFATAIAWKWPRASPRFRQTMSCKKWSEF